MQVLLIFHSLGLGLTPLFSSWTAWRDVLGGFFFLDFASLITQFWKILLLIGAFYLVPSVQFVTFQATTPQVDCYYNYKCKKDLGSVPAFNNIASNFLYIIAGVAFFIIVLTTRRRKDGNTGLHLDMSLYYSLSIVLCLEGIFSGLYHVCPSRLNFQFDSTFMMIGVALLFVTIFQKRHAAR